MNEKEISKIIKKEEEQIGLNLDDLNSKNEIKKETFINKLDELETTIKNKKPKK